MHIIISYLFWSSAQLLKIKGWTISGPEVIKKNSWSTQLSMKFFLLIKVKMPNIVDILTFTSWELEKYMSLKKS